MRRTIRLIDVTLRDAHRCLRAMRTEHPLLETPLLTLVKELSKRPSIECFKLQHA